MADIAGYVNTFTTIQQALNVISLLQLTSYRYPDQAQIKDGAAFDYIIAGGGTAGCVLANRLTEDPNVSVLLIEAGGDPPLESIFPGTAGYTLNSPIDWNYTASGCSFGCHPHNQVFIHKGKVLGGSSTINSMRFVRGSPYDYDSWAHITNDESWNYKNILQYFIKSERQTDLKILNSKTGIYHGTEGYIGVSSFNENAELENHILESLEEIGYRVGIDTNSNDTMGYTLAQYTVANGIRQSTANTYLSEAKTRKNLYVLKNHFVTKINIQNKTAVSVHATDNEGNNKTFKSNLEIIVSGGAINSPQMLILSGIGPKVHLEELDVEVIADLPVGENMHDHKFTSFIYTLGDSKAISKPKNPHERSPPIVSGFGALNKSQGHPDYQTVIFFMNDESLLKQCSLTYEFNDDICQSFYERSKGKDVIYVGQVLLHAKSRGSVKLHSKDPIKSPIISNDAFTDEKDLEDQIKYNQEFAPMINTTFFKSVGAEFLELEKCAGLGTNTDEYWRCHARCMVTPTYHQMGTCAMGSVVDSRLRVYGIKKLRVVDSSVMPTITSGNTYIPTIMIAEKAADMLKEDYKAKL